LVKRREFYLAMGRARDALGYLKKTEGMFVEMGMEHYLKQAPEALARLP